jgi:glutaredoxin
LGAQVLGCSVDHVPCLTKWAESLGGVTFPLLSDFWPHGAISEKFGVFRSEGFSERAIFVVDKKGIIRYRNIFDIDTVPGNDEMLAELRRLDPGSVTAPPPEPAAIPEGRIVMYCTRWCPDCKRAREWLRERRLEYVEVDVHAIPAAADRVKKWADGRLITPTFDIEGTVVVNFAEERLRELLDE